MQLIYSTSDLSFANQLAGRLRARGIETHVSNSHSSRLAGFGASRTPGFIGVWVIHEGDLASAHQVLVEQGLVRARGSHQPTIVSSPSRQLAAFLLAALAVAAIGFLLLSGP